MERMIDMFPLLTTDSTMLVEDEVDEGEDEGGVIASGETRYNVRAKVDRKKKKGKVKKGAMRTGNALVETDSTGRKVCYVKGHPEKEMYVRGPWTTEEDEQLMSLVAEMGPRRWCKIAEHMELRIGKQCRERYFNHLCSGVKKSSWSCEEDLKIIQVHKKEGNAWSRMAEIIPGRTANAVKNRWNSSLSKRVEQEGEEAVIRSLKESIRQKSGDGSLSSEEEVGAGEAVSVVGGTNASARSKRRSRTVRSQDPDTAGHNASSKRRGDEGIQGQDSPPEQSPVNSEEAACTLSSLASASNMGFSHQQQQQQHDFRQSPQGEFPFNRLPWGTVTGTQGPLMQPQHSLPPPSFYQPQGPQMYPSMFSQAATSHPWHTRTPSGSSQGGGTFLGDWVLSDPMPPRHGPVPLPNGPQHPHGHVSFGSFGDSFALDSMLVDPSLTPSGGARQPHPHQNVPPMLGFPPMRQGIVKGDEVEDERNPSELGEEPLGSGRRRRPDSISVQEEEPEHEPFAMGVGGAMGNGAEEGIPVKRFHMRSGSYTTPTSIGGVPHLPGYSWLPTSHNTSSNSLLSHRRDSTGSFTSMGGGPPFNVGDSRRDSNASFMSLGGPSEPGTPIHLYPLAPLNQQTPPALPPSAAAPVGARPMWQPHNHPTQALSSFPLPLGQPPHMQQHPHPSAAISHLHEGSALTPRDGGGSSQAEDGESPMSADVRSGAGSGSSEPGSEPVYHQLVHPHVQVEDAQMMMMDQNAMYRIQQWQESVVSATGPSDHSLHAQDGNMPTGAAGGADALSEANQVEVCDGKSMDITEYWKDRGAVPAARQFGSKGEELDLHLKASAALSSTSTSTSTAGSVSPGRGNLPNTWTISCSATAVPSAADARDTEM